MTFSKQMEQIFGESAVRPLTGPEQDALANITLFCVLFSNRSGSTLLCDSLYRRGLPIPPQVEILDPTLIAEVARRERMASFTDYFLSTVLGWAREGYMGFKAGPAQLAWLDGLGYLRCFRDLRLLSIKRSDKVAQAVSLYLAQRSGQWHSGMRAALQPGEVPYDAEQIGRALETISAMDAAIDEFAEPRGLSLCALRYEDLLENPEEQLARCCRHLGWSGGPAPDFQAAVPPLKKQATTLNEEYRLRFLAEHGACAVSGDGAQLPSRDQHQDSHE